MQKMPSPVLPPEKTSSWSDVAVFASKCYLLAEVYNSNIPDDDLDRILASMFRQSEVVLGIQ